MQIISIVIPVYKVEPYINKCLDSLLIYKKCNNGEVIIDDELMSLMDILIINDGTPDKSADISHDYVKRYPRYFRQIDKENGGHGSVWNLGVELAKGKYLKFLDSDDWLENLKEFLFKLQNSDSDLILTKNRCHCENTEVWVQQILDMEFDKPYDADTFDWVGNRTHNYLLHHCCTYKTEVLRQFLPGLFLEKQPYDDVVLWPAAMIGGKSIEAFDLVLYNYLMDRPGQSISIQVKQLNLSAQIKTAKHTIEFYEKHPVDSNTSKGKYISLRLPKMYSEKYKEFVKLPYFQGKELLKEWDSWANSLNPSINTIWIIAYRNLPYCIYYMICNSTQYILGFRKAKESTLCQYLKD